MSSPLVSKKKQVMKKHAPFVGLFLLFALVSLACQSSGTTTTEPSGPTAVPTSKPERVTAVPQSAAPITDQNVEQIVPLGYFEVDENVRDIDWKQSTTHPDPDQSWIAVATNDVFLYDPNDLAQGQQISRYAPNLIALSWDGTKLLFVDEDDIYVRDINADDFLGTWGESKGSTTYRAMAILSDNNHIVTKNEFGTGLSIWRLDGGFHDDEQRGLHWDGSGQIAALDSSINNLFAVGARGTGAAEVWQLDGDSLESLYVFEDLGEVVAELALSDNGRWLAVSVREGGLYIFDMNDGTQRHHFPDAEPVGDFAFSPDGDLLAASTSGDTIALWDVNEGVLLRELIDKNNNNNLLFSPDGTILLSAGDEGQLTFWGISE